MPHSFMIFDFGTDEEAAQQAKHRIDGWKQGFRLDKKLQVKFERTESEAKTPEAPAAPSKPAKKASKGKAKSEAKAKPDNEPAPKAEMNNSSKIRLVVRLDFSDHEKLSQQRWIERIPVEDPFKDASPRVVRASEPEFKATSDLFDSLD